MKKVEIVPNKNIKNEAILLLLLIANIVQIPAIIHETIFNISKAPTINKLEPPIISWISECLLARCPN